MRKKTPPKTSSMREEEEKKKTSSKSYSQTKLLRRQSWPTMYNELMGNEWRNEVRWMDEKNSNKQTKKKMLDKWSDKNMSLVLRLIIGMD